MLTRRRALVVAAVTAGAVLGLTTLSSSFALTEAAFEGPDVTVSSCQSAGGEYSVVKGTKTCTVVTTITFTGVEEHAGGQFEPVTDPAQAPAVWIKHGASWQSAQDVQMSTTWSQKGLGPVTEQTEQSVLSYDGFEYAICSRALFDETGTKLGGGLTETNTPCLERGLLPANAPAEQTPPPWQ